MNNRRNHYKKNYKGYTWTITRKLTYRWKTKFDRAGQNAWRDIGRNNGPFSELKREIAMHNWRVRNSWQNANFNKREMVLEIHNDYDSGVTTVKHVDSETVVKEKTFTSYVAEGQPHDTSLDVHVFGNSELALTRLDTWALCDRLSLEAYNDAINLVLQALT